MISNWRRRIYYTWFVHRKYILIFFESRSVWIAAIFFLFSFCILGNHYQWPFDKLKHRALPRQAAYLAILCRYKYHALSHEKCIGMYRYEEQMYLHRDKNKQWIKKNTSELPDCFKSWRSKPFDYCQSRNFQEPTAATNWFCNCHSLCKKILYAQSLVIFISSSYTREIRDIHIKIEVS